MARRKQGGIELIASMPWPFGIALGLIAFVGIRYGIGWFLSSSTNPYLQAIGKQGATGTYAPIAWLLLVACCLATLLSYVGQRKRRQLLDTQTGLDSLRDMSWREFEMLVGEAFRRQGYAIEETGLGGPDGGIDLIMRKNGEATLVQCKQWRTRRVDVKTVREMYGLLMDRGAAAVKIIAVSNYTPDAQRFAQGKPMELVHGDALLALVKESQTTPPGKAATPRQAEPESPTAPNCPKCGNAMVERENRRTKNRFWGCTKYPACHGTRATTV